MKRSSLWATGCILLIALQAGASNVFDEVLGQVDGMAKETARQQAPKSDSVVRAELQAEYNARMAALAEMYHMEAAKQKARSLELQGQPSLYLAADAAADTAMRLNAVKAEAEYRRSQWPRSLLFVLAISVLCMATIGYIYHLYRKKPGRRGLQASCPTCRSPEGL